MEGIEHKTVKVNGINMHVAEKGQGPVVLLLHGFPELWYTWRHQLVALADLGYRAVAPDLRGYGDTDAPAETSSYTYFHVIGDLVALIESLGVESVYLVAHDWGAQMGWYLCLFRPDLIKAYVALSIPFRPRHPTMKPIPAMKAYFGDDYYMCRFQDPGMEDEIAKHGSEAVLKQILADRKPGPSLMPKDNPFCVSPDAKLPSWLSQQDLKYYATKFDLKGFSGALNYYRALDLNWELAAPWNGAKVKVPVKFIAGEVDVVYTTPGIKEYVHGGGFKKDVPSLEEVVILDGAAHFICEERPEETTSHIHDFISKF